MPVNWSYAAPAATPSLAAIKYDLQNDQKLFIITRYTFALLNDNVTSIVALMTVNEAYIATHSILIMIHLIPKIVLKRYLKL